MPLLGVGVLLGKGTRLLLGVALADVVRLQLGHVVAARGGTSARNRARAGRGRAVATLLLAVGGLLLRVGVVAALRARVAAGGLRGVLVVGALRRVALLGVGGLTVGALLVAALGRVAALLVAALLVAGLWLS